MKGNIIVGQSGGPTAAINSSLAGVYRTAIDRGAKKVYGMRHGIQGLLNEDYIDLSEHIQTDLDVELLKRTPAAYLGSCRYKLPEIHEDIATYDKIFSILDKLEIECFIYIGGNDSMDTIKKAVRLCDLKGSSNQIFRRSEDYRQRSRPDRPHTGIRQRSEIHRNISERDHPGQPGADLR